MHSLKPEIKTLQESLDNPKLPISRQSNEFLHNSIVKKIRIRGLERTVELGNGSQIKLLLSDSVGPGDKLIFRNNEILVACENGLAKIYPSYREQDFFYIGNKKNSITIKQITEEEEVENQKYLASFHYRNQSTFGRSAKLVVVSNEKRFPRILGYIELNIAPIMNKARNNVLNSYYNDGSIKWDEWNFGSRGMYSKSVASISRVVVHPEFRGLNIGKILLKHAFKFCKEHWQVNGVKPIFIEIVADMLKFYPFAKNAGMTYIGNTEGNIKRLRKDLKFFLKNKEVFLMKNKTNSLIRMQSHYFRHIEETLKKNGLTVTNLINIIGNLEEKNLMINFPFLEGVIRFPKPTYMMGLNEYSQNFLERRVSELSLIEPKKRVEIKIEPIESSIIFENVSISFESSVKITEKTQTVKQAFGVLPNQINTKVISNFDFSINQGEIILVTGSSGTGKTVLLDAVRETIKPREGRIKFPNNLKLGLLKPLRKDKPLVELIGKSIYESLYILNKSGLSEAYLYLRKFDELSNGQQYRAMIAKLIDKKCNVWVADEFLNSLDFVTANIVASNIRNLVKKLGITLIVASASPENFLDSLNPDKIIIKELGNRIRVSN